MTPFDPGLQPERTALAWRRTALGLAVGSLAAARLLGGQLGGLLGGVGLAVAFALFEAARRRARHVDRALRADGHLTAGPGAALLATAAGVALVVGLMGIVVVTRLAR